MFSDIPLVSTVEANNSTEMVELFKSFWAETIQTICFNQAIIMQSDSNMLTTAAPMDSTTKPSNHRCPNYSFNLHNIPNVTFNFY